MNKKILFVAITCLITLVSVAQEAKDLIGRWDLVLDKKGKPIPSWLEVKLSGFKTLVGYFVSDGGSARPISEIKLNNGKFSFAIPPQWDNETNNLIVEGVLIGNNIEGTVIYPNGQKYNWTGERAPYLKRATPPVWATPIKLFNGKDLTGWKAVGGVNQWYVKDGILISPKSGANLISEKKFQDFKLHVEFRYQKGSNSGVYLRGRYEVQILDNDNSEHPNNVLYSGIYGFLAPSEINSKGPGEWQSYDITLVGRMVTVVANGKTVICNQEIPGITGGALDSNEGDHGPIYFQGDHGPIEFRNIIITPTK